MATAAKKPQPKARTAAAVRQARHREKVKATKQRRDSMRSTHAPAYRLLGGDQKEALARLELVWNFIRATPDTLRGDVQRAINEVLEDTSNKVRVVIAASVHDQMEELIVVDRDLHGIGDELAHRNLKKMPTERLLEYYRTMARREQAIMERLAETVTLGLPTRYELPTARHDAVKELESKGLSDLTPDSRIRVRELLGLLNGEVKTIEAKATRRNS